MLQQIRSSIETMGRRKRTGAIEIANVAFFCLAVILAILSEFKGATWLFCIIGACDVVRFILCGTWYHAPFHKTAHYWCPQKDLSYHAGAIAKIALYAIFVTGSALAYIRPSSTTTAINAVTVYAILIISAIELLRTLAHVLHKYDASWLKGTEGQFGAAELCASIGIAICLINIHVIVTECFGFTSAVIASGLAIVYVFFVELLGYYLRCRNELNYTTNVFALYENVAQKLFFVGQTVAIIIAVGIKEIKLFGYSVAWIMALIAAIAFANDVISFIRLAKNHFRAKASHDFTFTTSRRLLTYIWIVIGTVSNKRNNVELIIILATLFIVMIVSVIDIFRDNQA